MDRLRDGATLRILLVIAAVGLASAVQAQVPWNPAAPENRQLLPAFSYATVEAVLTAIRARHQRASANPGRPMLVVNFPNGRRAVVSLLSCNPDGSSCKALGVQSSWAAPAGVTRPRLDEAVARFNQRYSFSKAYVTGQGRLAVQRYLTADYGFIRGDLAVNLLVFADQANRFANEVVKPLTPAG
jgi:hypothetical protein